MVENDGRFHVTRRGREVLVGARPDLERAAALGRIGADDLVFDPETDAWAFARNHPIFEESTLPDLPLSQPETLPKTKRRLTPMTPAQTSRTGNLIVALSIVGGLAVVGVVAMLVQAGAGDEIDEANPAQRLARFLVEREGADLPAVLPAGSQVLPGSPPLVAAPRIAPPTPPVPSTTAAPGPPPAGPPAPAMTPPTPAEPRPPPPELQFDFTRAGVDGRFVTPSSAQRLEFGKQFLKQAESIIEEKNLPPGDIGVEKLMGALHRAEFAHLNLDLVKADSSEARAKLEEARLTVAVLKDKVMEACKKNRSERYCELKIKYPQWSPGVLKNVAAGKVKIGMSSDQVRAAWGRPTRLRRVGRSTQYCYSQFCGKSVRLLRRIVVEVDAD